MIIRIKEDLFLNVTPIRKWLESRGIEGTGPNSKQGHEYQFEYYGYEYNRAGDLQFYPIIHFKRDDMLTGPDLTEFVLRFGG